MTLFLLPNFLANDANVAFSLPSGLPDLVEKLDGLIAEDAKAGRAFLKRLLQNKKVADVPVVVLNEHTRDEEVMALLDPMVKGQIWGLVSDAGMPCLADPGAKLVAKARQASIKIQALPGPCSFMLALILSGLSGQKFAFHGYLPRDAQELRSCLQVLEKRSQKEGETQIFIETPYRNQRLLEQLLQTLHADTQLCVACDLTSPSEEVLTATIRQWKSKPTLKLDNRPTVFLFSHAK